MNEIILSYCYIYLIYIKNLFNIIIFFYIFIFILFKANHKSEEEISIIPS